MPIKKDPELFTIRDAKTLGILEKLWNNLNELSCIVDRLHEGVQMQLIPQTHSQDLPLFEKFNAECETAINTYYRIYKNELIENLSQRLERSQKINGDEGLEKELQDEIIKLREQYGLKKMNAKNQHYFKIEDLKKQLEYAKKH